MLTHPTDQRLVALGLTGMAKALEEQRRQPDIAALPFEDRLALLVDREAIERENKRLVSRLKFAGLRQNAVVEDIDMKAARGLDKPLLAKLVAGDWIGQLALVLSLVMRGPPHVHPPCQSRDQCQQCAQVYSRPWPCFDQRLPPLRHALLEPPPRPDLCRLLHQ